MKVAHLILAHKDPNHIGRLMNAMKHPSFRFFLHIDLKTNEQAFGHLANNTDVFLIKKRTKIYWAGFGTIQATLNGMEEILTSDCDYINVISGQDFPIQSPDQLYNYLLQNKNTEFITCESIEDEWSEAAHRIHNYHFINWRIPGKFRLQAIANKILPKRVFPLRHKIVGRANWFTITREAATYILCFLKNHPEVINYYKYCWGADEFIFSTILYNSAFKDHIKNNLVYVDWTGQTKGHPRILTEDDFEKIIQSGKFFARKMESDESLGLLNKLENAIRINKPN